ncbi:MAG TPA: parallel beta-helix domain-containing protein [Saprospiraceae bacterium]|nr:parallel beta-helix domain-containing protein [Saprospiraceae bacterium]HMP24489.1 parallel beta-helix domain-containing protein [Saprospiraceae bacterium]
MRNIYTGLLLSVLLLWSCQSDQEKTVLPVDTELYSRLQEALINARPGDVIDIPAGTFAFDRPLSLDGIANVTIQGAGMNETILSFQGQRIGAEGLKITADSVTIQDLTILDTKGDCIKIQDSRGVTLRNVKTAWSGGAKESNGGYGIYPVACTDVLIDNCEAGFASDAGIYVGQSVNVVVRNSYAYQNVAGIEIENCINAEVYDCRAENNTGGILVFDLPDLPVVNGHTCRVYRNKIIDNNHRNFAPEGNIVGIIPPGTGIILLAAKKVEVFDNEIIGHKTFGTAIASYQITQKPWSSEEYDPFSYDIYIHDNVYQRKRALPDLTKDFGKMVNLVFGGKPQDILYDGIVDENRTGPNPMNICIRQATEGLRFANVDAANDFKSVDKNMAVYDCGQLQ